MVDAEEEEKGHARNNKLLIDAITAKMTKLMDERFDSLRQESSTREQSRERHRNHTRNHSDREATEIYYSSSHSGQRRRRRAHEERAPNRDQISGLKLKIPAFHGTNDPDVYLDWEKKIELVFDCQYYTEENKVKVAATEFYDYALSWWDQLVTTRRRVGDFPIDTWQQMKVLMRKRFIPSHYHRELHFKLRSLSQGSMSVEEYYKEMETLMLRAGIREEREATLSRFMGGLNRDIQDLLEVQHYVELDELLHKAVMFEKQLKRKNSKTSFGTSRSSYQKDTTSTYQKETKPYVRPKEADYDLKGKAKEETRTRDVKCYKCQGIGHYARDCSNKRIMVIKENGEVESEDEQTENQPEVVFEEAPKGELLVAMRALSVIANTDGHEQRGNLFHSRCLVNGKICSVIVDGGSCTNVASKTMVDKLGLEELPHPTPYKLKWLNPQGDMAVNKQVEVPFSIGKYEDKILCDVLPMDACHILLGRPWQTDRRVSHCGYTNQQRFEFKGRKFTLLPMTPQEVYQDQVSMLKQSVSQIDPKVKSHHSSSKSNFLMIKDPILDFTNDEPASPSISKLCLQVQEKDTQADQCTLASPKNSYPSNEPIIESQSPKLCKLIHVDRAVSTMFVKIYESEEKHLGLEHVKEFYVSSAVYDNMLLKIDKLALKPDLNSIINHHEVCVNSDHSSCLSNFCYDALHLKEPKGRSMAELGVNETLLETDHVRELMPKFMICSFQAYRELESGLGDMNRIVDGLSSLFAFSCRIYDGFLVVFVDSYKGQESHHGNGGARTNPFRWSKSDIEPGDGILRNTLKHISNRSNSTKGQGKFKFPKSMKGSKKISLVSGKTDLRTNLFEEGGDDARMAQQLEREPGAKEQLEPEDVHGALELPVGLITRPKAKKLKQANSTLLIQAESNLSERAYPTTPVVIQAN